MPGRDRAPRPSAPVVRDAWRVLGVGPDDLATIVVTHIHLDHAGGVGDLAALSPGAEVVVHERGARHLVDPERLMASARRVFGRVLDDVFGVLQPTDAARITRSASGVGRPRRRAGAGGLLRPRPRSAPRRAGRLRDRRPVRRRRGRRLHPGDRDLRPATPPPDFDLELGAARRFSRFRDAAARTGCCSATSARSPMSVTPSTGPRRSCGCGSSWSGRRALGARPRSRRPSGHREDRRALRGLPGRPGRRREVRAPQRRQRPTSPASTAGSTSPRKADSTALARGPRPQRGPRPEARWPRR